jgi:hypothetical protein
VASVLGVESPSHRGGIGDGGAGASDDLNGDPHDCVSTLTMFHNGDRRVCAGVVDEHQLIARNENRRLALSAKYISTTQAGQVHVLRAAAAVVIYVDIG